jgi:prepilin-type N-terminal cleavage/methylation domain-containing protein
MFMPWKARLKQSAPHADRLLDGPDMLAKARTSLSSSDANTAPYGVLRLVRRIGGRIGRPLRLRDEAGFTLIEVLVAMVVLVIGLLGLLTMLDTASKASMTTRAREGATNLAREITEDARTIPYAQIIPTSIEGQMQAMNGLASSSATSWQIERRGFDYTVKVEECAIDDPKDGLAKTHQLVAEGGTFCEGQENWTGGTVDAEPEDLKRITAKVSWTIQKHTSKVEQVFTMTAAGQAIGLIATKLELTYPAVSESTKPVITNAATTALTFSVAFQEGASAIDWSLEGAKQEEVKVLSTAKSATFSWTISGVSDGTYQVSAQTVNSTGVIGPPISISVRLIRETPQAPSGIVGGFDTVYKGGTETEVGELQWKADSERDVIGYRVYAGNELICPAILETLRTATSCTDFTFSNKPSTRAYSVVALYRNATEEVTESPPGKYTISERTPPKPPTSLLAITNSDGSVTLKWTAPTSGTTPSFYRIYRGSKEYTSRYGTTLASECEAECSFTDSEPEATNEYWVTAVSPNLVESEPVRVIG